MNPQKRRFVQQRPTDATAAVSPASSSYDRRHESAQSVASHEIFYLPSYSPELNPDERPNASLKHAIGTTVPVKTRSKLKAAVDNHMTALANSPETVRAFFRDPRCKYAA